jgi:hypothetical protein
MSTQILYSAAKEDLYYPCHRANFFAGGFPGAEAALCAEMARLSYCRSAGSFSFDREKIRNVLSPIGFMKCEFFESSRDGKGRGVHGFLAVRGERNGGTGLAVLAFRGTDAADPRDIGTDADIILDAWEGRGKVHQGFARALGEVRPDIGRALETLDCRLLFTGHSLGAALATLMASLRNPASLYTFGSPRVGNAEFTATLKSVESHRYVDCCDLVTRIPPEFLGYEHVGNFCYINHARHVILGPSDSMIGKDRVCARVAYSLNQAWKPGNVWVRGLADHAPINYVAPLMPILAGEPNVNRGV